MRRPFFSCAGSAASADLKMIALRGGVERDHGPWGVATSLVFESYEAAFRDSEIDDGVLPSLTTEALSDDVARCPR
jgi:hypothetical protein